MTTPIKERRNVEMKVRLTESEHARLKEKASNANLSLADFLRAASEGAEIVTPAPRPDLPELSALRRELQSVGNNLNQIVRLCHMHKLPIMEPNTLTNAVRAVNAAALTVTAIIDAPNPAAPAFGDGMAEEVARAAIESAAKAWESEEDAA